MNIGNAVCRVAPIRIVRTVPACRCFERRYSYALNVLSRRHKLKTFCRFVSLRYATTRGNVDKALDLVALFPLRFVFVRTSVSFWMEYPEGLEFDVGYVDTKHQTNVVISDSKPIILGLPSSVGNHTELTSILMTFAKLGYRVVIPNLPGNNFCRGKSKYDEAVFQMSVRDKAEFVADFLKELKIEKVDMLVTNSCSVYTGVELCVLNPSLFRSLVMINPTGLKPTKSMLPVWLHKRFTKVYDERYPLHGILKACVAGIKVFTKKRHWETYRIVTYSRTIAVLTFVDEKIRAEYMHQRLTPRFVIFGEDSDFLDVKSTVEYLSILGIPESAITEVDNKNKIIKTGEPCDGNYGIHIQSTEDVMKSNTVLIRKELLKILRKLCPDL